jgi:hypothetical protein
MSFKGTISYRGNLYINSLKIYKNNMGLQEKKVLGVDDVVFTKNS